LKNITAEYSNHETHPTGLMLTTSNIHIWHASLGVPVSTFNWLSKALSADERQRADRLYFERDRRHFIICRGILRWILGSYLSVEPGELQFCYGENGKPAVRGQPCYETIRFNLSHSNGEALFAFTRGSEIGVDIEKTRDIPDMDQIAMRFFSLKEYELYSSLSKRKKQEAFFTCWTRKEAFIKATGDGLARPLNSFTVPVGADASAIPLSISGDTKNSVQWKLHAFMPKPGYVAALVIEGDGKQIIFREWNDYKKWDNVGSKNITLLS
jgi:4'-phosphopantetheinyl transferase